MKFDGTIIITDPCYLGANLDIETELKLDHLWDDSEYGDKLEVFGCKDYVTGSTLYGDWSCSTFKGDFKNFKRKLEKYDQTKEPLLLEDLKIGNFCADAGMVCVVYLRDILKVNPNFIDWIDAHPWCVTIIPNFKGEVTREVFDDSVFIVGNGNINFYTVQTGL